MCTFHPFLPPIKIFYKQKKSRRDMIIISFIILLKVFFSSIFLVKLTNQCDVKIWYRVNKCQVNLFPLLCIIIISVFGHKQIKISIKKIINMDNFVNSTKTEKLTTVLTYF